MDILADLVPDRSSANNTCDVRRLRAERPDLAEQFDKAIATRRFSDRAVASWITDHGFPIGSYTVGRHRRSDCRGCNGG